MKVQAKNKRIYWVDQWRGLAIILMIVYHIAYYLGYLEIRWIDQSSLFWFLEVNFVRISFLLTVGISLYLSQKKYRHFFDFLKRHVIRATKLFLIAMAITLATWFLDKANVVLFGILHLISFGIFLGAFLTRTAFFSILFGLLSFYLGVAFTSIQSNNPYLMPFGITTPNFQTFDYFPLFPWIGFVFLGIAFAHLLDHFGLLKQSKNRPQLKNLEFMGRHALLIYLVHQPVLFGILWLFA